MPPHTLETLKNWLADDSQFFSKHLGLSPENGLDYAGIRKRFRLRNDKTVSIQQSALHYCTADSVEMCYCPYSDLLLPYITKPESKGQYAWVPLSVVVDYLNEQETL